MPLLSSVIGLGPPGGGRTGGGTGAPGKDAGAGPLGAWLRHRNLRIRNLRPCIVVVPVTSGAHSSSGLLSAHRGGGVNRQPAGLWSRAVSVRVRVPQLPRRRLPVESAGLGELSMLAAG